MKTAYSPELMISRGIGILLVTFGHSEPIGQVYPALKNLIYSFHMPLFFLMAGFFSWNFSHLHSLEEWIKNVTNRLLPMLLPYVVISCSYFIIKASIPNIVHRPVELHNFVINLFCYPLNNPAKYLWFIYIIILIKGMSPLFTLAKPILVFPLLLVLYIQNIVFWEHRIQLFGIDLFFNFAPFFYLGLLLAPYRTSLFQWLRKPTTSVVAILIFVVGHITLGRTPFLLPVVLFVIALSGSFTVLSLCFMAAGFPTLHRVVSSLEYLGQHSLEVYMIQYYFIFSLFQLLSFLNIEAHLIVPLTFTIGLAGPLCCSLYILPRLPVLRKLFIGR